MFSRSEFVQLRAVRRKMDHEINRRLSPVERRESVGDFFLGIFTRSVKRRDVAVAEARPLRFAERRWKRAHLPVEIDESEPLAESSCVGVRLMISGQHPEFVSQRFEDFPAEVESSAKRREVPRGDVKISRLSDDALEREKISMNVAEDKNFHGFFLAGSAGPRAPGSACCGTTCSMPPRSMPSVSQPCLSTLPAESKTTR